MKEMLLLAGSAPDIGDGRLFVGERVKLHAGTREGFTSSLRNCTFRTCELVGWSANRLRLSNVLIEDCRTRGPALFNLCVFEHVTFRGTLGDVIINPHLGVNSPEARQELHAVYAAVDWAVDITACQPRSMTFPHDFPIEKVRFSPATAAVVDMAHAPRFMAGAAVGGPGHPVRTAIWSAREDGARRLLVVGPPETIRWMREERMTLG